MAGALQELPQPPQWLVLLLVSTHELPHIVPLQEDLHTPPSQVCPPAQAEPQPPQCDGFVCVLTQAVPHFVSPESHTKSQPVWAQTADAPPGATQALPQAPQCKTLDFRSAQALPHCVSPEPQSSAHAPETHLACPPVEP